MQNKNIFLWSDASLLRGVKSEYFFGYLETRRKKGITMIFDLEQTFYCFYIKYHFTISECTFISKNIFWIWEKIYIFL
jgi:hypothetical protein